MNFFLKIDSSEQKYFKGSNIFYNEQEGSPHYANLHVFKNI